MRNENKSEKVFGYKIAYVTFKELGEVLTSHTLFLRALSLKLINILFFF